MLEPTNDPAIEEARCLLSPLYFVMNYCWIYDNETKSWIPFELWKEQKQALMLFHKHDRVLALKARQLGLSWLYLGYTLWQMLFQPIASVLIFSLREYESTVLLSPDRLRGMYKHLPDWMKLEVILDNTNTWQLANGSVARAFATTGGDGYAATLAIIDEADLVPNLGKMLNRIEPTIDSGGKIFLVSRPNQELPNSEFKKLYKSGKAGKSDWKVIFLPWYIRPSRTQQWYDTLCEEALLRTGSLDSIYEQYPATDTEALKPAQKNKRLPSDWLTPCYQEEKGLDYIDLPPGSPTIPGLTVYRLPEKGQTYVSGSDCAEGLPTSNDSTTVVINVMTGEEVALMVGKYTPDVHAMYTLQLMDWYNKGNLMPENNNHGLAFIKHVSNLGFENRLVTGHNNKLGWSSTTVGKVLMYDAAAEYATNRDMIIHDPRTWDQLCNIEKGTLRAPEKVEDGDTEAIGDDIADAFAIAQAARKYVVPVVYPKWGKIRAVYGS